MKPIILLLLLGAIILVKASYMPTESPEQWRRRMMQPAPPTVPSWVKLPMLPTGGPIGYSITDEQLRERDQIYREMQEKKLRGGKKTRSLADDEEIALEKRRNLLVGRYGFRIGKRDVNDELSEADYEELVAEGQRDPSKAFVQ